MLSWLSLQDWDPQWQLITDKVKKTNGLGAMTHPCLTPVPTIKGSNLIQLFLNTEADMPSCRSLKMQMYLSGQLYLESIFHKTWRSTVSKAFVNSMKAMHNGCFCFLHSFFLQLACRGNHVRKVVRVAALRGENFLQVHITQRRRVEGEE